MNRTQAAHELWRLGKRALNQWLDAPDDRVATPVFVVGCQRSGTTMLIEVLAHVDDVWVHPEKSPVAYDDYRLRPPAVVDLVTRLTPAAAALYKPVCDSHLTDRLLATHPGSRAVWMVRRWPDVVRSAVRKWGAHQREVIEAIAAGRADTQGWRGERLPPGLVEQLAGVVRDHGPLSDNAGAALFWYVRNSFFFSLGLQHDPAVLLLRYEDLVRAPDEALPRVLAHLGVPYDPRVAEGIVDTSTGRPSPDDVPPAVAALCDALQARFEVIP